MLAALIDNRQRAQEVVTQHTETTRQLAFPETCSMWTGYRYKAQTATNHTEHLPQSVSLCL